MIDSFARLFPTWYRLPPRERGYQQHVIVNWLEIEIEPGVYRLTFDTATYHRDVQSFFPEVQVIFKLREAGEHVHVPLLISPFGYTTYRGT